MNIRNLRYNQRGTIDCEIEHPQFGWIPFTASPDDSEPLGRSIHAAAQAGEYGAIAAYVAPVPTAEQQQAAIAARRYQQEIKGFAWGGFYMATDRESQAKIDAEDRAIDRGLRVENSGWKCLDLATNTVGFRPTSNAEMQEIAAAAYSYVSACFAREAELLAELEAGTYTEAMLDTGWPA